MTPAAAPRCSRAPPRRRRCRRPARRRPPRTRRRRRCRRPPLRRMSAVLPTSSRRLRRPTAPAPRWRSSAAGLPPLGLLALLFLASRRSTRGYISSVVGKAFGSAASVKSTKAVAVPPSAAAASAANLSPAAAAFGKGVLLDNSVRQRTGMSWYRVTRAQLLAAPEQAGVSEVSPWSALVVDGVAVPYRGGG